MKAHLRSWIRTRLILSTPLVLGSLVSVTANAAGGACPPQPEPADVKIIPMDEVRQIESGTIAQVYTVFKGKKTECFRIKLEGMSDDGFGAGQDVMVFTPEPGPAAQTNIVHGMSGSPVYVQGRLLGALSLDLSMDFSVRPTGAITPAAIMHEIVTDHAARANQKSYLASVFPQFSGSSGDTALAATAEPAKGEKVEYRMSGFSQSTIDTFQESFSAHGMKLVAGGSSARLTPSVTGEILAKPDPAKVAGALKPGAMIVIPMIMGDISMATAGTVTYNEGNQILAFGHPGSGAGSVRLPMMTGEVVKIVTSTHESFKITNGLDVVGALVEDRATGVMGILGEAAPVIPVTVDIDTGVGKKTFHFSLAKIPGMEADLTAMGLFDVMTSINEAGDGSALSVRGSLKLHGHGDYNFSELSISESGSKADTGKELAMWVGHHVYEMTNHPHEAVEIDSMHFSVAMLAGPRLITMEKAVPLINHGKAGSYIPVRVTFRLPHHPELLTHDFNISLPKAAKPGIITAKIMTSIRMNEDMVAELSHDAAETSLQKTLKVLSEERSNGALYVSYKQKLDNTPLLPTDFGLFPLFDLLTPPASGTYGAQVEVLPPRVQESAATATGDDTSDEASEDSTTDDSGELAEGDTLPLQLVIQGDSQLFDITIE